LLEPVLKELVLEELEPVLKVLLLEEPLLPAMKPVLTAPCDPDVNLEPKPLVDDAPAPKLEDPEEMPLLNEPEEPELMLDDAGILPWKQPAHNGPSPAFWTREAPTLADPNELVLMLLVGRDLTVLTTATVLP